MLIPHAERQRPSRHGLPKWVVVFALSTRFPLHIPLQPVQLPAQHAINRSGNTSKPLGG
ncbi:MAG: hypothetical protein AAGI38_13630 [Bacteroidota bacterium]